MRFSEAPIPLSRIDPSDSTYRITTAAAIDDVTKSIARIGLIHPPIVQPMDGGYRVVSGFRRAEAVRVLGWTEIPARWLSPEGDEATRVHLAIADNSLQRPLNRIETSRALNLLSGVAEDERHLIEMAAALSLPDNPSLIAKILPLASMPSVVQEGVASGHLPLPVALELNTLDIRTAVRLARIFTDLRLGLNRQRELLTLLSESAKREDRSVDDLLDDTEVKGVLDDADPDNTRRSARLRALLFRRRYPTISETSARFERLLKGLDLGPGVRLAPPANFEGTNYTLSISFDRIDQLVERGGRCLEALGRSDALKAFLEE